MNRRAGALLANGAAAAAVAAVALSGGSESPSPSQPAAATGAERAVPAPRFGGAVEDCATRSEATFPGAFTDRRNLVAGPLVLVGGAYTPAATVRQFGGNKFPLLVRAGRSVTVRLAESVRSSTGLAYGPLPQGKTTLRDTYRSVTFVACRPGSATQTYDSDGPSGTYADGVAVTFWSGFVLTRGPACIPLDVYIDDTSAPRRVGLSLGLRCER